MSCRYDIKCRQITVKLGIKQKPSPYVFIYRGYNVTKADMRIFTSVHLNVKCCNSRNTQLIALFGLDAALKKYHEQSNLVMDASKDPLH